MDLPSRCLLSSAQSHQVAEPLACKVHVSLGCLPGTLLERVKHINSVGEPGDVQDSMFQGRMHTDFPDARPDKSHGLPIERLQTLLHSPELEPGQSPSISWERSHVAT